MTTQSGLSNTFQALPNPRRDAVRIAEMALTDARPVHAFVREGDTLGVLRREIGALQSAGWLPAQRFGETLVLVSPLAGLSDKNRNQFAEALRDFSAAVERRNLRELACSTLLFEHYRGLYALMAAHTRAVPVSFDDLALAGRAIPPATLRSISSERLARVRAHYERVLLMLLCSKAGELKGGGNRFYPRRLSRRSRRSRSLRFLTSCGRSCRSIAVTSPMTITLPTRVVCTLASIWFWPTRRTVCRTRQVAGARRAGAAVA